HKIIAHGIPTSVFNCLEGIELVKDEIRTFNKAGSMAIAFATPEEASAAVRNRLYIAGISI
ncbi:hypothetical protein LHYA1_G009166, partial [Lachnellula hyalina]